MREGWDSWAFAIERIEIISQKCTAALESCLFHDLVSGGLPSCASFMTRHSTDESCSLVISLSGVAGVILGNTNERIHICGRWAPRATVRSKAAMLFPMWATQGCLQPFEFTDLAEDDRRTLESDLGTFLGQSSSAATIEEKSLGAAAGRR